MVFLVLVCLILNLHMSTYVLQFLAAARDRDSCNCERPVTSTCCFGKENSACAEIAETLNFLKFSTGYSKVISLVC
jgi:hypothetical protein